MSEVPLEDKHQCFYASKQKEERGAHGHIAAMMPSPKAEHFTSVAPSI
jgi:hypothetical protein